MRMWIPGCLLLLVLSGCGASAPAATAEPTATNEPPTQQPGVNYPPDPVSVVQSFLSGLQIDGSGAASLKYLDQRLAEQAGQASVSVELLGTAEPIEWFEVNQRLPANEPDGVHVRATLHYRSHDDQVQFTLTDAEAGRWQISTIGVAGSAPPPPGGVQVPPQDVALGFVKAVVDDQPFEQFLAPALRTTVDSSADPLALLALTELPVDYRLELVGQAPGTAQVEVYFSTSSGPLTRTIELENTSAGDWVVLSIK